MFVIQPLLNLKTLSCMSGLFNFWLPRIFEKTVIKPSKDLSCSELLVVRYRGKSSVILPGNQIK